MVSFIHAYSNTTSSRVITKLTSDSPKQISHHTRMASHFQPWTFSRIWRAISSSSQLLCGWWTFSKIIMEQNFESHPSSPRDHRTAKSLFVRTLARKLPSRGAAVPSHPPIADCAIYYLLTLCDSFLFNLATYVLLRRALVVAAVLLQSVQSTHHRP